MRRLVPVLVTAGLVLLVVTPVSKGRVEANEGLKTAFAQWTKKLNADFRDLNGTLRSDADSLADYVFKVGRLYTIADRIQRHATEAQDELGDQIASGDKGQVAKRRALKAFDLLRRSGEQWQLFAKCGALGGNVPGIDVGCRTTGLFEGFFDVFDTLKAEKQAELEQELQGYLGLAKRLSRNAATLLKLANEGLDNPLKTKIDTGTKPIDGDAPVVEEASWTGVWTWSAVWTGGSFVGQGMTIVQKGRTTCASWPFSGGGTAKGPVSSDGRTWGPVNWNDGFGKGTWTLKLEGAGRFTGTQTVILDSGAPTFNPKIVGERTSSSPARALDCDTLAVGP